MKHLHGRFIFDRDALSSECTRPLGFYFRTDGIRAKPNISVPGLVLGSQVSQKRRVRGTPSPRPIGKWQTQGSI